MTEDMGQSSLAFRLGDKKDPRRRYKSADAVLVSDRAILTALPSELNSGIFIFRLKRFRG